MPSISDSKEARRYLQSLACVSKSMQPLVEQTKVDLINAGVISIGELPGINDLKKALNYIDSVKTKINNLNLFEFSPTDEDIETILSNCPNVTSVTISYTKLTDKGLEEVGKLKSLTSLHLRHCNAITDKSLEEVAKLRSLTSLDLRCSTITDKAFEKLADLKDLTSLSLMRCSDTTDKGLEGVAALKSLTFLNLMGCYKITDEGLKEVAKLQSLTSLYLAYCDQITDTGRKKIIELAPWIHIYS